MATAKPVHPFSPNRVIFSLIVLPVLAAFAALLLAWFGPDRYAVFGWNPIHGTASNAQWCSEMNAPQQTPELQAAVDAQRALPEFAQLCGR